MTASEYSLNYSFVQGDVYEGTKIPRGAKKSAESRNWQLAFHAYFHGLFMRLLRVFYDHRTPQKDSLRFENEILRTDTGGSMAAVFSKEPTASRSCAKTVSLADLPVSFAGSQDSTGQIYRHTTTIGMLPDEVFLEIFDFYRMDHDDAHGFPFRPTLELEWRRLTHVCQRWRQIVFGSPLRLDLKILCTHATPFRKNLDLWPAIPLVIDYNAYWGGDKGESHILDDLIAALEQPDRIRRVRISVTTPMLRELAMAMQEPLPMLTHLWLSSKDEIMPVLPETFLGDHLPSLRSAHLEGISFAALPTILLSSTDLVDLQLLNIPKTCYVSPDATVACLTGLTRLETLSIGFQMPPWSPSRRSLPPFIPIDLPSLTSFNFQGVNAYLEDLVAQIDTPVLKTISIMYFNRYRFRTPRLSEFISRTKSLDPSRWKRARVDFGSNTVCVRLDCDQAEHLERHFILRISNDRLERLRMQVLLMGFVLGQCFAVAALTSVDDLTIDAPDLHRVETTTQRWGILRPFAAAKTLHISKKFAAHITEKLVAEMFPALRSLSFEDEPTCVGGL